MTSDISFQHNLVFRNRCWYTRNVSIGESTVSSSIWKKKKIIYARGSFSKSWKFKRKKYLINSLLSVLKSEKERLLVFGRLLLELFILIYEKCSSQLYWGHYTARPLTSRIFDCLKNFCSHHHYLKKLTQSTKNLLFFLLYVT